MLLAKLLAKVCLERNLHKWAKQWSGDTVNQRTGESTDEWEQGLS